jgi:hypothetical protein
MGLVVHVLIPTNHPNTDECGVTVASVLVVLERLFWNVVFGT